MPATIREQSQRLKATAAERLPAEVVDVFDRSIKTFLDAGVPADAVKAGDKLDTFTLDDATGSAVTLEQIIEDGPAVVVFYRGGWCPYCNLALRTYQNELLPQLPASNARLVAISPQPPDESLSTAEKGPGWRSPSCPTPAPAWPDGSASPSSNPTKSSPPSANSDSILRPSTPKTRPPCPDQPFSSSTRTTRCVSSTSNPTTPPAPKSPTSSLPSPSSPPTKAEPDRRPPGRGPYAAAPTRYARPGWRPRSVESVSPVMKRRGRRSPSGRGGGGPPPSPGLARHRRHRCCDRHRGRRCRRRVLPSAGHGRLRGRAADGSGRGPAHLRRRSRRSRSTIRPSTTSAIPTSFPCLPVWTATRGPATSGTSRPTGPPTSQPRRPLT